MCVCVCVLDCLFDMMTNECVKLEVERSRFVFIVGKVIIVEFGMCVLLKVLPRRVSNPGRLGESQES